MRSFDDLSERVGRVPASIVLDLSAIERGAGREDLYRQQLPAALDALARRTRVESVRASSAIEDIVVDNTRLRRLVRGELPRTRLEAEVAGYRDALDHVLGAGVDEPFTVPFVLRLHRLLFGKTDEVGGRLKDEDNRVVDVTPEGRVDRFKTVPAREAEFFMRELHARLEIALGAGKHHPLLLAGLYALDLLVIHPFMNGNGRVARLATTSLLHRGGFGVVRYVAVEGLIDRTSDVYYQTLAESTVGWHEGRHDPWPWLSYLVERVAEAYGVFERKAAELAPRGTKQERVEAFALELGPPTFSKDDIRAALLDVSDATIARVLQRLRADGKVLSLGQGPTARWERIVE